MARTAQPRFACSPSRRCEIAEIRRAERGETGGGEIWEAKVVESSGGDYHRVGDIVIVELAR